MRLTVILTDEEYAVVRGKAGLIPLSRWVRDVILKTGGGVAELEDARLRKSRDVGVAGQAPPVRTQPIAGSSPAPATKPVFVVPAKFQNRYCKEHHMMPCDYCAKRAIEEGGAY